MQQVSANEIITFVRSIEGTGDQELKTAAQSKAFTVRAVGDGIEYTPSSTGKPRAHPHRWLSRICDEFSRTNSFKPVNYQRITVNASYALAVIARYLQGHSRAV